MEKKNNESKSKYLFPSTPIFLSRENFSKSEDILYNHKCITNSCINDINFKTCWKPRTLKFSRIILT